MRVFRPGDDWLDQLEGLERRAGFTNRADARKLVAEPLDLRGGLFIVGEGDRRTQRLEVVTALERGQACHQLHGALDPCRVGLEQHRDRLGERDASRPQARHSEVHDLGRLLTTDARGLADLGVLVRPAAGVVVEPRYDASARGFCVAQLGCHDRVSELLTLSVVPHPSELRARAGASPLQLRVSCDAEAQQTRADHGADR